MGRNSRTAGALAGALGRYKAAPLGDRLFLRGRALLADLGSAERHVPQSGAVVDLGCGRGLFANLLVESAPGRDVLGIDPDPRRIAVARLTERPGLRFRVGDALDAELPACDAVTLIDVLYLLPEADQRRVVARAAAAVRPGGRLVVYAQERRADPRFWVGFAQELVATRSGLTRGSALRYSTRSEMVERLEAAGLRVSVQPLRGRLYTDAVYVGDKAP